MYACAWLSLVCLAVQRKQAQTGAEYRICAQVMVFLQVQVTRYAEGSAPEPLLYVCYKPYKNARRGAHPTRGLNGAFHPSLALPLVTNFAGATVDVCSTMCISHGLWCTPNFANAQQMWVLTADPLEDQ